MVLPLFTCLVLSAREGIRYLGTHEGLWHIRNPRPIASVQIKYFSRTENAFKILFAAMLHEKEMYTR